MEPPQRESGLRVEVSEDASHVVMKLDRAHAVELARIISHVSVDGQAAWARLARQAGEDTWLGTILRLIACSEDLQAVGAESESPRTPEG